MNKQKGLAPILIVILIALAIGGYLIYQKQTKPVSVSQPVTQSSPSSAVSPVPNGTGETTNWKTYTNKEYGYYLKYPSSWIINEEATKSPVFSKIKINLNESSDIPSFTITVGKQNSLIKKGLNKTTLGDVPATSSINGAVGGIFNETISTSRDNYDYILELGYTSHEDEWEQDLLQKILSTFKFTQ